MGPATPPAAQHTWTACPVCGGARHRTYVEFDRVAFVQCERCTTVFKSREAPQLLAGDFYERGYFHGRRSGRDKRFEHRVRKAQRWIGAARRFLPGATSVLDVGCSLGYVIEAGRRLGLRSAGADVSEYAVQRCVDRGLDARRGELGRLPFDTASFDLCVMKHVLEHSPDPRGALAEVRRVLTPGGVVLIAVPDVTYWKGTALRRSYRYYRPDDLGAQHYVYYSRQTLRVLLGQAGYTVLAQGKDHLPPGASSLRWLAFAGLRCGYGAVRALRLQRELFFIARCGPPATGEVSSRAGA